MVAQISRRRTVRADRQRVWDVLAYDIAGRPVCLLMAQLSNTMLAGLATRLETTHV